MESLLPHPPPPSFGGGSYSVRTNSTADFQQKGWEVIQPTNPSTIPCQRSLHAGAVWRDYFIVFGGYDGLNRVNDLYAYHFPSNTWNRLSQENAPSPRDRHIAVVHDNSLYIFGGFDGVTRVNDLYSYDLTVKAWRAVTPTAGNPPTPRHSHSAVVFKDSMYIFGGYDGSYRSDFHAFHFPSGVWRQVVGVGDTPRARYRGTCVVCQSSGTMILHGGHDGSRHLQDTHLFDFYTQTWALLVTEAPVPLPRDSHVAVIYGRAMYIYGGSTGAAMGDFHELRLEFRRIWSVVTVPSGNNAGVTGSRQLSSGPVPPSTPISVAGQMVDAAEDGDMDEDVSVSPGARFCHVGVVYDNAFYIFGGYDGSNRLNDFLRFRFDQLDYHAYPEIGSAGAYNVSASATASSTLINDLKKYVNCDLLSDVQFVVEGQIIYAHKILCLRCPYFRNMLTGEYMESRAESIIIPDVKYATFLLLLEYLYTDAVAITVDTAMDLFQVAARFAIDRLKDLCEQKMLSAIDVDTAAHILLTADQHNALNLREKCMGYVLRHFDRVSVTSAFEEMGRSNVDLIFEVLRRRQNKA